jgi:SAM-dependent methyltransferase
MLRTSNFCHVRQVFSKGIQPLFEQTMASCHCSEYYRRCNKPPIRKNGNAGPVGEADLKARKSVTILMATVPPDWQLPAGVTRGLWHYLHDENIARSYDNSLESAPLVGLDQAFVLEHCAPSGRLIDLGCGTGRLLVHLAVRGYNVLGVDLSAPMLRVARQRANAAGVDVNCIRANLVELGCLADSCFDFATCLFSTLGMVSGLLERSRVVEHVYRLLRPGGMFVLHVHNRWFNAWNPPGRRWLLRQVFAGTGDYEMPAHDGVPPLTLHLFTRRELFRLLRRAGFKVRAVQSLSLNADGKLAWPRWFSWLRAYGYLVAAQR